MVASPITVQELEIVVDAGDRQTEGLFPDSATSVFRREQQIPIIF